MYCRNSVSNFSQVIKFETENLFCQVGQGFFHVYSQPRKRGILMVIQEPTAAPNFLLVSIKLLPSATSALSFDGLYRL